MVNKYLRPRYSTLKLNKLDKLSKRLQTSLGAGDFFTQEQYLAEAVKVLTTFYKTLSVPIFDESVHPQVNSLPQAALYNQMFEDVKDNLDLIFAEFENIEDLIVANFNFAMTGAGRLNARLKKVSSLVGDYILYSDSSDDLILCRDSFNNTDKIELGSSLLNAPECTLNQDEGIITLPVDISRNSQVAIYRSPIIKGNSGASYGNNFEINADWHGDATTILDNNPDTWFEYERVVRPEEDTGEPLSLDITLQLNKPGPVNFIRINPNNFGTRTAIKIEKIETSIDGKTFISVKDDVPIIGYLTQDEENTFNLAPSTSKYAGQGLYTFTPRKAKYVHFVFSQSEPYTIETSGGLRLRYAIGLRDIEVRAISYLSEGEIISRPFSLSREIIKAALRSSQNPIQPSQLAYIEHYVSADDGASWHQIQPQQEEGTAGVVAEVAEIVNFNNADTGSITTSQPVTSVTWKAKLARNDAAFTSEGEALYTSTAFTSEIHDVPHTAPHSITLHTVPIEGTVQVVDPLFGSRGIANLEYRLGNNENQNMYFLPEGWRAVEVPFKKVSLGDNLYTTIRSSSSDWMHVFVDNKEWSVKTLGSSLSDFSSYDIESEVYAMDWDDGILYFGDGHTYGKSPGSSRVALRFDAERLAPIDGAEVAVPLAFQSAPDKKLVKIKCYGVEQNGTTSVPSGATVLRLAHQNIITVLTNIPGTEKDFANGQDEFTGDSQWSINKKAGIVYLSSPNSNITAITYTYQPISVLQDSEWEWATTGAVRDSVKIRDSAWKSNMYTYTLDPLPTIMSGYAHVVHLPHLNILKKTVRITSTMASGINNPFVTEVPFENGHDELSIVEQTTEDIPPLSETPIFTFQLSEDLAEDIAYDVIFDETAQEFFTSKKETSIEEGDPIGTYYIDRDENEISVRVSATTNFAGRVSYFYTKPDIKRGLYSIDYANGIIYTQESIVDLDSLIIEYEYSDYRIEYPIARLVSPNDYEVSYTDRTVTFSSAEILSDYRMSKTLLSRYEISYDYVQETREDVQELKEYFTPVLKDYILRLFPRE